MAAAAQQRYSVVAIVLHWAIAIALLGMIPLGWWMGDALENPDTQAQAIAAFQLHKSIGLTVLALSVLRLGWRLVNPGPPLPEAMKPWERLAAKATHWAFYILILALPLSGWLYVSTAWSVHDQRPLEVPTMYFGLFQAPHLFGLSHLAEDTRATLAGIFEFGHSKMAWLVIGLTALHVGAALKHQFMDKDGVLGRMVPGMPDGVAAPNDATRMAGLAAGFAAIAIAAGAAAWTFSNPPTGAPVSVVHSHDEGGDQQASEVEPTPTTDDHSADGHAHDETQTPPANSAEPPAWRVDRDASRIAFSGTHAGVPFEGRFSRWRADIRFDPANLEQSRAVVTVETASASDGVPVHDNTLPQAEWFDVANHPTAVFRTTSIRTRGGDAYEARGTLTIKDAAFDLELPFTLRINGDRAIMEGRAEIDRREANLGMSSDPDAEYVSREIGVRVHVEAVRVQ